MRRFRPGRAGRRTSRQRIANQLRAIPQPVAQSARRGESAALRSPEKTRDLTEEETAELELATDEALGRIEPPPK